MYRVMMEHYVKDEITTSKPFRNFFMTMTEENAGRACRGQPSATYEECESRWNRVNPVFQRKRKADREKDDRTRDETEDRIADKVLSRIGKSDRSAPPKKHKKQRKGPFCKYYNKGPCPNMKTNDGNGCIGPNKVSYEHSCDVPVAGGRVCGSLDHNALTHPGKH